jgi:hypothetical protein
MTSIGVRERVAAVLTIGGTLVLVSLVTAPDAGQTPDAVRPVETAAASSTAGVSEATSALDKEAARLRERLAQWPARPSPERNLFAFAVTQPTSRRAGPPTTVNVPAPEPAEVAAGPETPPLVAITADLVDGAPVRQAAFSIDGRLVIVKAGEKAGLFLVESIGADAVTLVLGARTFHVAIR